MDDLYRAIADPTRRAILDELVQRDGQSLFEICGRLVMKHGITIPASDFAAPRGP